MALRKRGYPERRGEGSLRKLTKLTKLTKKPINYKNSTMKNGSINLYKKIWLGLKMFTNLSTSINDISFVDFINLLVSMDTIIILNLPPFSSVFCVKNPQIYVRNP